MKNAATDLLISGVLAMTTDAPIKAINGYRFLEEDRGGRNAGALEDAVLYSRQASGHSDTAYLFSQVNTISMDPARLQNDRM